MQDFSAAFFAKLVAGNLQSVDEHTIQHSSSGPAKKINPHNFLPAQHTPKTHQLTTPIGYDDTTIARLEQQAQALHPHVVEEVVSHSPHINVSSHIKETNQTSKSAQPGIFQDNSELVECIKDITKTFKSIDSSLKKLVKHFVKNT